MNRAWRKKGLIFKADAVHEWWFSHTMAPSAILIDPQRIRIFCGCWNSSKISSIGFIDVDADNPSRILDVSKDPVLVPGRPGTFDDNGVFPAHASVHDGEVYLYYTGFQLVDKVRYTNFGGLAKSTDGNHFRRVSEAPVLDRADEGLHVRAGQSVVEDNGIFKTCYSAGTGWEFVKGELRPRYDVFYQESVDGLTYQNQGTRIVQCDSSVEHGLGRPQIVRLGGDYYVFYTRRIKENMKYHLGCAKLLRPGQWKRIDEWVALPFGSSGEFDSEMVYFPSVIQAGSRTFLFYCGNAFGREGLGYAELEAA